MVVCERLVAHLLPNEDQLWLINHAEEEPGRRRDLAGGPDHGENWLDFDDRSA
jgi:hypothetical protein